MPRALKIVLALLAVPVLVLGAGFVHGIYLAATGQYEPREQPAEDDGSGGAADTDSAADTTNVAAKDSGTDGSDAVVAAGTRRIPASVVDTGTTQEWMTSEGFVRVEDGVVRFDRAKFAELDVDDAVRLHAALRKQGREANATRLLLFAGCGELPVDARREFARRAGAVHEERGDRRGYIGDFTHLFHYQDGDAESVYARATRRYAEVLESDDVTDALIDFGAIIVEPTSGQWHIRVQSKLDHLDPDTLMALRDAIGLFFGLGDRKYVREQLAEMADEKRAAASFRRARESDK